MKAMQRFYNMNEDLEMWEGVKVWLKVVGQSMVMVDFDSGSLICLFQTGVHIMLAGETTFV